MRIRSLPVFASNETLLRPPRIRDSLQIYRCLREPVMRRFLRTAQTPRPWHGLLFVLRAKYDRWRGRRLDWMIILRKTGEVIGCRSYFNISHQPPPSAEIGLWVARPFWGRQLGDSAVEQANCYVYGTLGIHRLVARVDPRNERARPNGPHEQRPWTYEGRLRDHVRGKKGYRDMDLYSRLRTDSEVAHLLRSAGFHVA